MMEQEKQWTALKRSILKLIIFMNSEKTQPAREAQSRYNTQDASLSWKPGGFWMAAEGDLQQPQEDEAFNTFKTRDGTRIYPL